jgi:putative restriction endonuclease
VVLLAVLDLAESDHLTENRIFYESELLETFRNYFEVVRTSQDALSPWLPFYHLTGDGFWHLVAKLGKEPDPRCVDMPGSLTNPGKKPTPCLLPD